MGQPQIILNASRAFLIQNEKSESFFVCVLTQAIEDVFSTLGKVNKQAIYLLLKNNFGINEKEIPYKIEDFSKAINQIFGSASKLIEIKIIERLHTKYKDFKYTSKKGELELVEFVFSFRNYLDSEV